MLYRKGSLLFNEINEQPNVWRAVLDCLTAQSADLQGWLQAQGFGQIIYVSSGDYYNLAVSMARITHLVVGLNSAAVSSSELLYGRRPPYDVRIKTLAVFMSNDALAEEIGWGLERLKLLDPRAQILLFEAGEAKLATSAHRVVSLQAAKDATKIAISSASSMVVSSLALISWLSGKEILWKELVRLPDIVEAQLKTWQGAAQVLVQKKPHHLVFLGSGPFIGLAQQAALMMRELAGTTCEAHSFMEYRLGSYSTLTNQMAVVGLMSNSFGATEERIIGELAVMRVNRLAICDAMSDQLSRRCDDVLELKAGVSEIARVLLMLPVLQLFCCYMAIGRGGNPDNPKHFDHGALALKEPPGAAPRRVAR